MGQHSIHTQLCCYPIHHCSRDDADDRFPVDHLRLPVLQWSEGYNVRGGCPFGIPSIRGDEVVAPRVECTSG